MKKRVYILGAGASADFSPKVYAGGGIPSNRGEFMPVPFPTTNNFINAAIRIGKLRSTSKLMQFINKEYRVSFDQLSEGYALDVEKVCSDIDVSYQKIDEYVRWDRLTATDISIIGLKILIEELLENVIYHYVNIYALCENYKIFANHLVTTEANVISFNWDIFLDEALAKTGKWFFESGYGFDFERIYQDKKQLEKKRKQSPRLLIKPHGSINWFHYKKHYSMTTDGFTGEEVTDEDRSKAFLMLFNKDKIGIHPKDRILDLAKNWDPLLKMPCGLDIIYPGKKIDAWVKRINYSRINENMKSCLESADEIIAIGFALKDPDADKFKSIKIKYSTKIMIVNKDNSVKLKNRYKSAFKINDVEFLSAKTFKQYCEQRDREIVS